MTHLDWLFVAIVTITSSARITRLVAVDSFPPIVRFRMGWDRLTNDGEWSILFHCLYCFSFWATALVIGTGIWSDFHPAWWIVNSIFGASYLAAYVVRFDGDDD